MDANQILQLFFCGNAVDICEGIDEVKVNLKYCMMVDILRSLLNNANERSLGITCFRINEQFYVSKTS